MSTPWQAQLFFPTNLCHVFVNTATLLSQQPHIALTRARHHLATTCRKILNILARSENKARQVVTKAFVPRSQWNCDSEPGFRIVINHVRTPCLTTNQTDRMTFYTSLNWFQKSEKISTIMNISLGLPRQVTFKRETVLYRKRANAGQKKAGIMELFNMDNMDTGSIGVQKGSATFCRWEESSEEHKLSTFLINVVSSGPMRVSLTLTAITGI